MNINKVQQKTNINNKPSFQARIKFSENFAQHYTSGKLEEVTKAIKNLGSDKDSIDLSLKKYTTSWSIESSYTIKDQSDIFSRYNYSRYGLLNNVLDNISTKFQEIYGNHYQNLDKQADDIQESITKKTKEPVNPQKQTDEITEKGINSELEELINKKVEEKIKNIIDTKLETLVGKMLAKQIKTNPIFQPKSAESEGLNLVKLAKEYTLENSAKRQSKNSKTNKTKNKKV